MTNKLVIGMAAYGANEDTLAEALRQAVSIADRVMVVWGRFIGFDLPSYPVPDVIHSYCMTDRITLIVSDQVYSQEKQRDLFLNGLHRGDILWEWDSDMILRQDPYEALRFIDSLDNTVGDWDALMIPLLTPDHEPEQETIMIYRYQPGWRHVTAGALGPGRPVAAPDYRIVRTNPWLQMIHLRDQSEEYRRAQRKYWEGLHGSQVSEKTDQEGK